MIPLLRWLAAGAALGACARVNYLLFPSLYSEWLYTGDLLRLGFYLMLLVGAVSEIVKYWSAQVATAATLERERLARDLHDGAVQELGYIWSQSLVMTRRPDAATAQRVHAAAERALDETRRVVDALNASPDEPLADSLRRAAADVANRYAAVLKLDLDESVHVDGDHREALVRIVREAVGNAARHASATVIEVVMTPGVVRVRDDGRGFDPAAGGRPGGHGLAIMRDRAEGAGGRFRIESAAGRGTTVEVTW
jgi:signal transduction histidine kinase